MPSTDDPTRDATLPPRLALPPQAPTDIRVYHARVSETHCDTMILDASERERAAAFRFESDRHRYVSAHVLLRQALADRFAENGISVTSGDVEFEPQSGVGAARSKPRLARHLRDRLDLHFSLSHGGDHVLVATAQRQVGVDVEPLIRPEAAAAVVNSLHRHERAQIAALPALQQPAAVSLVWVRKESLLKALGTGLSRSLDRDDIGLEKRPRRPVAGWTTVDLPLEPGTYGALTWAT